MRLDVVIPTYNAPPERLARAVASARACPEVAGILVVDDGSPTPVRPELLAGEGAPIRIIRQVNAGPSAARNRGIDASSRDAVLFLDDDDELLPEGVSAMVRVATRHGAAGVQGARVEISADGRTRVPEVPAAFSDGPLSDPEDVWMPVSLFGTPACLVTRRAVDAGVRFDEGIWIQEDRDFLRRVAGVGPLCVSRVPAVRIHKRADGTNLTAAANLARRVRDHMVLLDRHLPIGAAAAERAEGHWRRSTVWLLNNAAKAGVPRVLWRSLAEAAVLRGWRVPLKARARAALRCAREPAAGGSRV